MMLLSGAALAETAHEHLWTDWAPAQGGSHTGVCAEDGDALTAKCYTYSAALENGSISACGICGVNSTMSESIMPLLEGVTATPTNPNPGKQRGTLIVRGLANPSAANPEVLYAFTLNYEWKGGLATFKNPCDISIPLNLELPESWRLVRITPRAGDDSVQNPEKRVDMECTYVDGVLTFNTRTPAMYMILAQ